MKNRYVLVSGIVLLLVMTFSVASQSSESSVLEKGGIIDGEKGYFESTDKARFDISSFNVRSGGSVLINFTNLQDDTDDLTFAVQVDDLDVINFEIGYPTTKKIDIYNIQMVEKTLENGTKVMLEEKTVVSSKNVESYDWTPLNYQTFSYDGRIWAGFDFSGIEAGETINLRLGLKIKEKQDVKYSYLLTNSNFYLDFDPVVVTQDFFDDFNRANNNDIDNGWIELEYSASDLAVDSNKLQITSHTPYNAGTFRPLNLSSYTDIEFNVTVGSNSRWRMSVGNITNWNSSSAFADFYHFDSSGYFAQMNHYGTDYCSNCQIGVTSGKYSMRLQSNGTHWNWTQTHYGTGTVQSVFFPVESKDSLTLADGKFVIGLWYNEFSYDQDDVSVASQYQDIASEEDAESAIEGAIVSVLSSPVYHKEQQVYLVNSSESQFTGSVDYLVIQTNPQRRWIINYVSDGEVHLGASNLSSTVYVLEMANVSQSEISDTVTNLISTTKD